MILDIFGDNNMVGPKQKPNSLGRFMKCERAAKWVRSKYSVTEKCSAWSKLPVIHDMTSPDANLFSNDSPFRNESSDISGKIQIR